MYLQLHVSYTSVTGGVSIVLLCSTIDFDHDGNCDRFILGIPYCGVEIECKQDTHCKDMYDYAPFYSTCKGTHFVKCLSLRVCVCMCVCRGGDI